MKLWKGWGSKKKIIIVGAAAAAAAVFVFKGCFGGAEAPPAVQVGTITRGSAAETLSVSGPVSGTDSVDVVSNIHAEILDISVKEGDRVKKGQVIAVLDESELSREAEIARNSCRLAEANYEEQKREAENGYAKAAQDYGAAKANYERTAVLFQAGDISQVELETAKNAMDDAARQAAAYTVENGKAVPPKSYALQIENARFELQKKEEELQSAQIRSPIDGTVVRVNTRVGRFADKTENNEPLFIIENLDVLEMRINVSEYSIGKVSVGQKAVISADILNGVTVEGEVTSISPTGEEKGGGSTERVVPATIRILDKETALIAGITARARLLLAETEDALLAPLGSVYETSDGEKAVALVDGGTIKIVPVETGVESDLVTEIKPENENSLAEGDLVVLSPSPDLEDGMAVTPVM